MARGGPLPDNGAMNDLPVLSRPRADAVAAGVCAGVAQRLRIDPIIVRVLVVALAFAGGFGIALYLAAVATIPREGKAMAPAQRLLPFLRTWPTAAATLTVAAAIMVCFGLTGGWGGAVVLPVVGVAVAIYAVTRHQKAPAAVSAPEPTPFERAADAWQQRLDAQRGLANGLAPVADVPPLPVPVTVTAPPKPRRGHGWAIALGLSAVSIGVLAAYNASGHVDFGSLGGGVPPAAYAAAVLLSFGIALLASVRTKRPRGMVPAAIAAAIVTGILFVNPSSGAHVSGLDPEPSIPAIMMMAQPVAPPAAPEYAYKDVSALPASINLGVGSQTVDLSALTLISDASTSISLTAGDLYVVVPEGQTVQVDWAVKAGEATLFDEYQPEGYVQESGLDLSGHTERLVGEWTDPILHVTVNVGSGNLTLVAP